MMHACPIAFPWSYIHPSGSPWSCTHPIAPILHSLCCTPSALYLICLISFTLLPRHTTLCPLACYVMTSWSQVHHVSSTLFPIPFAPCPTHCIPSALCLLDLACILSHSLDSACIVAPPPLNPICIVPPSLHSVPPPLNPVCIFPSSLHFSSPSLHPMCVTPLSFVPHTFQPLPFILCMSPPLSCFPCTCMHHVTFPAPHGCPFHFLYLLPLLKPFPGFLICYLNLLLFITDFFV